jgi:preprotein translocase subunit SecA
MGQKDPLVEWQREGFDMFGQMMHGVWQDFVRYVMHVDVKVNRPAAATPVDGDAAAKAAKAKAGVKAKAGAPTDAAAAPADAPALEDDGADTALRDVQYSSPDDPSSSGGSARLAAAAQAGSGNGGEAAPRAAAATQTNTPVVRSDWDKTPRNAPCPCGSGKKYKLCHGKA